jgi:hypothetical protein
MIRRIALLLGISFLLSLSAHAQILSDKVEVSGGYSYMHFGSNPGANLNGFDVTGQYRRYDWLGAVLDIDGHYGTVGGVHASLNNFMVGPQVSWPSRISPFAHLLFGVGRYDSKFISDTSFAWAVGAGVDDHLTDHFSWRIIEGDYLSTSLGGGSQTSARLSTAIVYRF